VLEAVVVGDDVGSAPSCYSLHLVDYYDMHTKIVPKQKEACWFFFSLSNIYLFTANWFTVVLGTTSS